MFNNSAVYQYFRYCATKLLLLLLNYHDDVLAQYAGYIILLFEWKMSKLTKNAFTRSGGYSDA